MPTMTKPELRTLRDLRGRRVLVLGFARSGVALARTLTDAGAAVTVYDRRTAGELADAVTALDDRSVDLALAAEPDAVRRLAGETEIIFTSPSISWRFPTTESWLRTLLAEAEGRGTPILSEVDLFLRLTRARVLAVTGTKGKTTTSALLGQMLDAAGMPHVVGGNIGRPLVELTDQLTEDHWAVLELSELQLPTISRGAHVAVYTNILADHMDRHGTMEAYRAVKARLAELAPAGGAVVLNGDDPVSAALADRLETRVAVHRYGLTRPGRGAVEAWTADGWIHVGGGDAAADEAAAVLPVADVPLPGAHMLSNVLAAALGAHLVGVPRAAIAQAIRSFPGVPHRLETLDVVAGVRYVNDSQATIPVAAIAALRAFDAPVVLIAGGKDKGLDYSELGDVVAERCRAAVLLGETAPALVEAIAGRSRVETATSMDAAVRTAHDLARPGDVVLLAPAAASFDMFADYEARGEAFRRAVRSLGSAS